MSAAWWLTLVLLAGMQHQWATAQLHLKKEAQVQFPSFSDPDATTVIIVLVVKISSIVLLKISISRINKGMFSTLPI